MRDLQLTQWFAQVAPPVAAVSKALELTPVFAAADMAARVMSPSAWGTFYRNPLGPIMERLAYGPGLRRYRAGLLRLCHLCADGQDPGLRARRDLDRGHPGLGLPADARSGGRGGRSRTGVRESYRDGCFTGNPTLFPLSGRRMPEDLTVVNINPLCRPDVPKTGQDIQNRINEISFNSSLLRELRAIAFVSRLIAEGRVQPGEMSDIKVHMVAEDELMRDLGVATKLIPSAMVLARLKEAGRAAADAFPEGHKGDLGGAAASAWRERSGEARG